MIYEDFDDIPSNHYQVIYADPPWNFKTRSDKGRGRSPKYNLMGVKGIKTLPVQRIAADDAVLLLWITDPFLNKGEEIMEAWGFRYSTVGFYWVKRNRKSLGWFTGMGYWTRANPEICLLGVRGTPKRKHKDVRSLIESRVREHSRKPEEAYGRIERLIDGPYIELFGRTERPGWDVWGNEVGKFEENIIENAFGFH